MNSRPHQLPFVAVMLVLGVLLSVTTRALCNEITRPFINKQVYQLLEMYRDKGLPITYSTNLVPDTLLVTIEPQSHNPLKVVEEILKPHGLMLSQVDGVYLVTREARGPPGDSAATLLVIIRNPEFEQSDQPVVISSSPGLPAVEDMGSGMWQIPGVSAGSYQVKISVEGFISQHRTVEINAGEVVSVQLRLVPEIVELDVLDVSASRYKLFSNVQFFVDQRAIQNMPGNADDPVRAMHRLPGTAAGGWTAKSHFRGGENNESAIFLNGLQLLEPFHARDFHNTFSSVDARTISGVEAYTGGFPAVYGDRMSGIMILQSSKPAIPRHYELGLSVFNTSFLASGFNEAESVDWLFSARRSNLGLVLVKPIHGEPDYNDLFASLGFNLPSGTRLTINALRAKDDIVVVAEPLIEEYEQSTSDTLNQQLWINLEKSWPGGLNMSAVLSASSLENDRDATVDDEEQLTGFVNNDREIKRLALRLDFDHYIGDDHLLSWGAQLRKEKASYLYQSEAEYGGIYLAYPGVPEYIERDISLTPDGYSYSAYISDRWRITPQFTIDAGLRWDKQTYIISTNDDQLSPRINMLYSFNPQFDLRLTWGRYHQSQGIHELQVEDGVEEFYPAQQAEHWIAGVNYRFNENWSIRAEAFIKQYSNLRPRYENLLDPVPLIGELEPDRVRIAPHSAYSRGIEITANYTQGERLNWWATYTLSRITDRIDGVDELRNWDQTHSLQAGLLWQKGPWDLGVSANVHTGWPTTAATLETDEDGEFYLEFGPRNAERLNMFASFSFRIAHTWPLENGRVSAFFEVSNLFDRQNQCCVDYDVENPDDEEPELERSAESWLGRLPAVGILWEF